MFWSPALTTLSVCATPGADASADSAAATNSMRNFMGLLPVLRLTSRCGAREQQQRVARNGHRDRRALRDAFGGVPPDVRTLGANAIAIGLPDVEALDDVARQRERAVAGTHGRAGTHRRDVAAEVRGQRLAARRVAADERAVGATGERDGVVGAHEARDERRLRAMVDLLGRA